MLERDHPQEAASKSETRIVRFFFRAGILVIVIGALSLSGLLLTFANDPSLNRWGWEIFRFGLLGVFLLMDIIVARIALWAWAESKLIAWSFVFVLFVMLTFGVIAGLFLGLPQLRDSLFYSAIFVLFLGLLIQAMQERRRKRMGSV